MNSEEQFKSRIIKWRFDFKKRDQRLQNIGGSVLRECKKLLDDLKRPEKRPLDYDEAADSAKRLKTDGDHFASS